MKNNPRVSVIMAAYNAEKYIAEAIESILRQTEKNFELIVVDDGSDDNTKKIICSFSDPRIIFLQNKKNAGSVFSRNRAVLESSAPYLAILDSDDIAVPNRLEMEANFLDQNPDFGVIGGAVELIGANGKFLGKKWRNPLPAEMIPGILLFQNYLANSSSMFRRDALPAAEPYRDMEPADDYDLWVRINYKKWKIWNLPQVLVKYRIHGNNLNEVFSDKKKQRVDQIMAESLKKLGLEFSDEETKFIHQTNYKYPGMDTENFLFKREKWLLKIKEQNHLLGVFSENGFNHAIAERWLSSCSANFSIELKAWRIFWKSDLSRKMPRTLYPVVLRFAAKIILSKLGWKK